MLKAQEEFIDRMTRKMLVDWCALAMSRVTDEVPSLVPIDPSVFLTHALQKKWVSGAGPYKILSTGYDVAARTLK